LPARTASTASAVANGSCRYLVSEQMDDFGAGNEVEPCQRHEPIAIKRWLEGKVERRAS